MYHCISETDCLAAEYMAPLPEQSGDGGNR